MGTIVEIKDIVDAALDLAQAGHRRDNSRGWWLSRWPLVAVDRTSARALPATGSENDFA